MKNKKELDVKNQPNIYQVIHLISYEDKRLLCSEKLKKTKEVVDNTLINNFLHLYKIEIGGDNCKSHF